MNVKLLDAPSDIIRLAYSAARTCYSAKNIEGIWDDSITKNNEEMLKLVRDVLSSGHHSVLEHIKFTIAIDGISRATSHQLVRHRIASYSQQSQRYVDATSPMYVIPPTISKNQTALKMYQKIMEMEHEFYNLIKKELNDPVGIEDARYVLGNAYFTNIVMSVNLRELIHVCNERLCARAQWEIRKVFKEVVNEITKANSWLSEYLVPKCDVLGFCPEPVNRTCGRKPMKG